jgi:hypothetical protein
MLLSKGCGESKVAEIGMAVNKKSKKDRYSETKNILRFECNKLMCVRKSLLVGGLYYNIVRRIQVYVDHTSGF